VILFVDTSVWSLAFRRDRLADLPEVNALRHALESEETIVTTGLVLQELLQGFVGPRARKDIIEPKFLSYPVNNASE
jgi:predicted nucleic acid-binding protein